MSITNAQADPVFLLSWLNPLVLLVVLVGWAWVISQVDKDAKYFHLHRYWWNLAQMGCGVLGFGMMLLIPVPFLGVFIGLVVLAGGVLGYAYHRNTLVPERFQWSLSLESFTRKFDEYQHQQAQKRATLTLLAPDEGRVDVPSGDDPDAAAHTTLENVLDFALLRNADRIDLLVDTRRATLTVRIDGVRYPQAAIEPAAAMRVIEYLKSAAGLDVSDRRKKQTGQVRFDAGELGRHTMELSTSGSTRGVALHMEIDTGRRVQMPLVRLGLLESQKQHLQKLLNTEGKVVLVAAPPRHGSTTTLYSLLHEHDPYTASVVTLEDEIAFELEGVSHNLIEEGMGSTQINERLGAILRADPQVVLLSQFHDARTAALVAKHAQEVRFYVPVPKEDTFAALKSWVKAVENPRLAAAAVGAVVSQRLVRLLCKTCRTPYQPDQAALKKLNLSADRVTQFYHASGQVMIKDHAQPCPSCQGLGYRGRVGAFELMVIDDEARKYIAAADYDRLRAHLRKQRMLWLQEAALAKVVEGLSDIKEITRALSERPGRSQDSDQGKKTIKQTERVGSGADQAQSA